VKSKDFMDKDDFALDEKIAKIKEMEVDANEWKITHLEVELDKSVAESVLGAKKSGIRNNLNVSALEKGTGIWMDNGFPINILEN